MWQLELQATDTGWQLELQATDTGLLEHCRNLDLLVRRSLLADA
jgi:hypothetical protein